MQPAARNAQTSLTALHRAVDLHRRNRPLGTRQGLQLEHTISRLRITPKMSFFIHHNEQDTEHKRTEIWIEPSINGRSLKMELDTGSALSIIPLRLYSAHFADLELSPSSVVLKTYTGRTSAANRCPGRDRGVQ